MAFACHGDLAQDAPAQIGWVRIAHIWHFRTHHIDRIGWDDFETRDRVTGMIAGQGEQLDDVLGTLATDPGRGARDSREQLQRRGGYDAKRPFSPGKHMFQIIAGIVLTQAGQPVPDFSRW